MRVLWYYLLISGIGICQFTYGFEILTAVTVGLTSIVVSNTYCRFKECCTENEIPANFTELDGTLRTKLYGQPLVHDILINALKSHWDDGYPNQKALTFSFHGWAGGGKNYVATFIQKSLYKLGGKSRHVHLFMGRIHFPLKERVEEYKQNLYQWIKGNVTNCAKQLFIFDEVDKMPPTLLNVIKPLIDYNENVDNVDYRQSIFIFLSNTGSAQITSKLLELWNSGKRREDLKLSDFEKLITQGAFNEEAFYPDCAGAGCVWQYILQIQKYINYLLGGFHHADAIKANLIDHYIPFLPLEMKHVELCILDEFKLRGVSNPRKEHIQMVMDFVEWGPSPENLYSKTGCKRLSQKVAVVVQKYYYNIRNK